MRMGKKVIVFAPHQDDEILSSSGTIDALKKYGAEIYIVFATNGDFWGRKSAAIRLKESLSALEQLQIKKENIIVLGFADTGMDFHNSFLWRLYNSMDGKIIESPVSNVTYHPLNEFEYSMKRWHIHLPYTKDAFLKVLKDIIIRIDPDVVIASSRFDMHGDHAGLCMLVEQSINELKREIPIFEYIIHSGNDKTWPERETQTFNKPLNISEELWRRRIIVPVENPLRKKRLIQLFASQISSSGYLLSFAKKEEIFFIQRGSTHNEKDYKNVMAQI